MKQILSGALLVLLIASVCLFTYHATPSGTGLAAKQLCSVVFLTKLPPEQALAQYVEPIVPPLAPFLSWSIDPATRTVRTSAFGFAESTAVRHSGYGCIRLKERSVWALERDLPSHPHSTTDEPSLEPGPDALNAVVQQAMKAPGTQAVVVSRDGRIAAEAYAAGVTASTPLPGWSMAKSLTATIAGVMVRKGLLSTDEVALFDQWEEDERVHISFDNLLRMTSGIDLPETHTGADATSHMLFQAGNAVAYATSRTLSAPANERFEYSSGSTVLAAGLMTERLGGARAAYDFYRKALFEPLGMTHMTAEPDEYGNFVGSSFVMASARDWMRLGQLYLQNGRWQGQQLLPETWVDYVTTHTVLSGERGYGAGFWLAHPAPEGSARASWPAGTYFASGMQNNMLIIVPSLKLLVVRLGATRDFDESGVAELMTGVVRYYSEGGAEGS